MVEQLQEFEGTWEELAQHAEEFNGRRLRLVVLPEPETQKPLGGLTIEEKMMARAALIPEEEWRNVPPDFVDRLDEYLYGSSAI